MFIFIFQATNRRKKTFKKTPEKAEFSTVASGKTAAKGTERKGEIQEKIPATTEENTLPLNQRTPPAADMFQRG